MSLTDEIREYLKPAEGKTVYLRDIRTFLKIEPGSNDDINLRKVMSTTLVKARIVSNLGRKDGAYKVVRQVKRVPVFGVNRTRRPSFNLVFPRDYDTMEQIEFAEAITMREGDLMTIGGVKSKTKTTMCLNFCGENIDKSPILMGNEYTVLIENEDGEMQHEPSPRFIMRLDLMDINNGGWIKWVDDDGNDKFELLPVTEDYAEHVVKDRINIIDWINLDGDKLYDIGKVLGGIKANIGRGVAIVALQKGEGAANPRGGQFVRDYSDVEILLDGYGNNDNEYMLTIKGAKEKTRPIVGNTYAYTVGSEGTRILNFREVEQCKECHGKKYTSKGQCEVCIGRGMVDKG